MKKTKKGIGEFIAAAGGEPVKFRDLMQAFGVSKAARHGLKEIVDDMLDAGELVKHRGNAYSLPKEEGLVQGRLTVHREGYGFVIPDGGGDDLYIPAKYLQENLHGDRVEVRPMAGRGGKREGRIVRTLERGQERIVGTYEVRKGFSVIVPQETRIPWEIVVPARRNGGALDGQVVVAEIVTYPTERRAPEGRVVEILGWPDDPEVEVRSIVAKFALPYEFPPEVLAEAREKAQPVTEKEARGRVDLRGLTTVTIDGETARDFDDAVSVRREGRDVRLWVSIADVSHYVRPGSALDAEARLRGTSVYFPDRAIPMLPEALSTGICSLNPHVERLAMTAEMLFDPRGLMKESDFYPSVIRSDARLTYTIVRRIVADCDPEAAAEFAPLVPDLMLMRELAAVLTERRRRRGSIDFDLPEPQIILDLRGRMESIVRAERNVAHRLIEEFMLSANEAVATFIARKGSPSVYRVHEPPDPEKIDDFREFIFNFGYTLPVREEGALPADLQRLLNEAEGKPEKRMINEVLLRCMKQARYTSENLGHYGLASPCYTHFTSPIRRYPDLMVHRILREVLAGGPDEATAERLGSILPNEAAHASKRERTAMEAEREIVDLKKVQYMRERIGEEYDGIVTGVASFGFFVELVDLFVEGMVHVTSLSNDYYTYFEKQHSLIGQRTGEVFRIGDAVRVRVAEASLERRQISFILAGVHEERYRPEDEWRRRPVTGKRPPNAAGRTGGGGGKPSPGGARKGAPKGATAGGKPKKGGSRGRKTGR
jgi:ribonuclease R